MTKKKGTCTRQIGDDPLMIKHRAFVERYVICCNATEAAEYAGYSKHTANRAGSRLLGLPAIKEAIAEARKETAERVGITRDWVLSRVAALADSDMRRLMEWRDGSATVKDSDTIDWRDAYAISEIKVIPGGGKNPQAEIKIKLGDKVKNLELLMRHMGMLNDKLQVAGDADNPQAVDLRTMDEDSLMKVIKDS